MYPPPEFRTSGLELLGNATSMILTAVVAVVGLGLWLGFLFRTDAQMTRQAKLVREEAQGRASAGEVGPGQGDRPWESVEERHVPEGGHPHGKPRSYVLVAVIVAAFAVGGVSIVAHAWWLFWTCAGILLLCIPAGKMVGIMNDTIAWGSTPGALQPSRDPGTGAAQRGTSPGQPMSGSGRPTPRTGPRPGR